MEHGWQAISQDEVSGTPVVRDPISISSERVEVDEAGQRTETGQHVGQRHRGQ